MTCRRSFPRPTRARDRRSSTASGWTHPQAHSSSLAPQLSGQRSLRSRGRQSYARRDPGKAYEAQGGDFNASAPPYPFVRIRPVRRGRRSGTRVDRGSSPSRGRLQPRVLRASPVGQQRDPASPARDRPQGIVPFARCRGQRLRPDPRRDRFQGVGVGDVGEPSFRSSGIGRFGNVPNAGTAGDHVTCPLLSGRGVQLVSWSVWWAIY